MAAILGGAFAIITIYSLSNPFVGLLGLLAADMLRPGELYPSLAVFHIERLLAVVLMVSVLFHRQRLAWPPITKSLLIFWGALFISVPLSIWRTDALSNAISFGRIIIYHVLVVNLVTTERRYRAFLLVYAALIGWLAATSLYGLSHGLMYHGSESVERAEALNSFGGNPNSLGISMVVSIPLVFLLLAKGSGIGRLVSMAVVVAAIATTIYTGSRTSYLALAFLVLAAPLLRRKRLFYLPVAVLVISIIWMVTPQNYKDRVLSVESRNKDLSYINRLKAWEGGWRMFVDNPVTGVGVGEFAAANGMKYWPDPANRVWLNAHSLYFQCLGELGLVGVISFLYFLYRFFRLNGELARRFDADQSWASCVRNFPVACNLILLVLLFAGYSGHDLYRSTWYMMAGLAGALQLMVSSKAPAPEAELTTAVAAGPPGMLREARRF